MTPYEINLIENQSLGRDRPCQIPNKTVKMIREQVGSAISQAGNMRFILALGCSVPTHNFNPLIRAVRDDIRAKLL